MRNTQLLVLQPQVAGSLVALQYLSPIPPLVQAHRHTCTQARRHAAYGLIFEKYNYTLSQTHTHTLSLFLSLPLSLSLSLFQRTA